MLYLWRYFLRRCQSGQLERTVNPPAYAYGGSNPSRRTKTELNGFFKARRWHAPRAKWLEIFSYAPRKPHALASTPATPKEKTLLAFLIWRG